MMRKLCFLLLIICSVAVVNGQNYIPYFHNITEAENQIRSSEFSTALETYDSLFKVYTNVSYKNIHNACICAIKIGDFNSAFKYAKQLVLKGYEIKDFEESAFVDLRNKINRWNSFLGDYKKIRKQRLAKLKKAERNYYYQKHLEDQKAASSFDIPVQDSAFFKLAYELTHHINKNGFPNLFLLKDTLSHNVQVMFRHYYGLFNRIKNDQELKNDPTYASRSTNLFKGIIDSALTEGLISPLVYVSIVTYFDGNPYGELAVKIDIDNEKVYPLLRVKPEELDKINSKRNSIGLPSINDDSSLYLKGTWYSDYPFKEVKQAVEKCDTCKTFMDYHLAKIRTELKFSEKYKKKSQLEGFLLIDYTEVRSKYCKYKFMKDLRKNGVNTERTR
jgi:hypothetical protein